MAKYSLVMTLTPCGVAGCIISIRPTSTYSCAGALTYLLTYLLTQLSRGIRKTGNISETVEDRAKVTNGRLNWKMLPRDMHLACVTLGLYTRVF